MGCVYEGEGGVMDYRGAAVTQEGVEHIPRKELDKR